MLSACSKRCVNSWAAAGVRARMRKASATAGAVDARHSSARRMRHTSIPASSLVNVCRIPAGSSALVRMPQIMVLANTFTTNDLW